MPMASRATTSRSLSHIPNGETKHAVEMIEDISAPLLVTVDDHFRVGIRSELDDPCPRSSARSSLKL